MEDSQPKCRPRKNEQFTVGLMTFDDPGVELLYVLKQLARIWLSSLTKGANLKQLIHDLHVFYVFNGGGVGKIGFA